MTTFLIYPGVFLAIKSVSLPSLSTSCEDLATALYECHNIFLFITIPYIFIPLLYMERCHAYIIIYSQGMEY